MSEKTFAGETRAPVVLCILDGWGNRADRTANAIALADTPTWDRLVADCPTAELVCHGPDVGLPAGQMGNSEVGHLNIGAGRIVWQDLPRINNAIAEGSLADHPLLVDLTERLRESGGVCHLAGIASPGGVHGHENHLLTLAKIVASRDVPVHLHIFLDGRDTPPTSAADDVSRLETAIADIPGVRIATLIGRYFAMDRDHRWERVRAAHNLLVEGTGASAETASQAVADAYAADTTDEFIPATVITGVGDRVMRERDLLDAIRLRSSGIELDGADLIT
ncbi:MAG: 2,3-bisphosphoglycerate-independent phosphoglycerate mutase, partial [Planctomycetota bacterium]